MEFWRWYVGVFIKLFQELKSFKFSNPLVEYSIGVLVLVFCSLLVVMLVNAWYLFLTIPVGITIAMHGWWRWDR